MGEPFDFQKVGVDLMSKIIEGENESHVGKFEIFQFKLVFTR